MPPISEKDYYDEFENYSAIKNFVSGKQTGHYFQTLYKIFYNDHTPSITAKQFRSIFFITHPANAYNLLEALVNLHLLAYIKKKGANRYIPTNEGWWHEFGEMHKSGNKKEDRTIQEPSGVGIPLQSQGERTVGQE